MLILLLLPCDLTIPLLGSGAATPPPVTREVLWHRAVPLPCILSHTAALEDFATISQMSLGGHGGFRMAADCGGSPPARTPPLDLHVALQALRSLERSPPHGG